MTEINIQKKSTNPMWWVLAVVAVVIVGWLLFARGNDRAPETSSIGAPASELVSGSSTSPASSHSAELAG
jgi:hypothetical protein